MRQSNSVRIAIVLTKAVLISIAVVFLGLAAAAIIKAGTEAQKNFQRVTQSVTGG